MQRIPNRPIVLLVFLLICFSSFSSVKEELINKYDANGNRTGYWVVDAQNNPTSLSSKNKQKEGSYIKGRKQGAWILYHNDGETPRLIGEYSDNRPKGVFFRFGRKGNIAQAGVVNKKNDLPYAVYKRNELFACRMLLSNYDVVAGQVFFEKLVFNKPYEYQFWLEDKYYDNKVAYDKVSFNWLNQNYSTLFANFLAVRSPKVISITADDSILDEELKLVEEKQTAVAVTKTNLPPHVTNPSVANGMVFQRNGFNKLYTPADEIWMDGLFRNGQLYSGKVFEYDKDGVLFRVRVYQEGVYVKDGMI